MTLITAVLASFAGNLGIRIYDLPSWSILDVGAIVLFVLFLFISEIKMRHNNIKLSNRQTIPKTIKKVPGPLSVPFIGTRWIYYGKYKLNKVHDAYQELFRNYGPIIKEEALFNIPIISIIDAADIEKVLRQSSRYPIRPPTEVIAHYRASRPDHYTNLGIINEQGEVWHKLRSLLTPELTSTKTMNRFFPELNNVAEDFNRLLLNCRDGVTGLVKGFDELACRMGLESSCTLILGKRLGFLEQDVSPLANKLAQAVKDQFCASRDTYYGLPFWKLFPTPAYKKFMACEDTIYDVISEMVDNAEKLEADTCDVDAVSSVFMAILKAQGLDAKDKKAGIIDFIAAGIKTLGNTLVFMFYLIAKNKRCQEKLFEEINRLAPNRTPLDFQALKEAHYLRACIMEAFRILPTAPCVARVLETGMELSGYQIPPMSVVLCHTWLACLQEANFDDAMSFVPERWIGKDTTTSAHSPPFLVVPFGIGRRMCPGKRFIELELQVVLAQTVRQFEIEFDGELELEFEFLLAPKSPANFSLKERQ